MNDQKFCFIVGVSDLKLYEKCAERLDALKIPVGYSIEIITLDDPCNFSVAYNKAMRESDAKYKIYMHQDVQLVNLDILHDILDIFSKNPKIGMLGVRGAKTLPTSGLWWDSSKKFGKLYESVQGETALLTLGEVKAPFEAVRVLDGIFLATQYDVAWNEKLIGGLGFLESAHSLEFIKHGYELINPLLPISLLKATSMDRTVERHQGSF